LILPSFKHKNQELKKSKSQVLSFKMPDAFFIASRSFTKQRLKPPFPRQYAFYSVWRFVDCSLH
ncbi:hypothetical protein, partial [Gordonibacter urolithinfaciens]|uniref:hypothetical protein n=1 Tax=Gordonibacter urolithinfaciens TaxID=1335613 RepID=UPI003A9333B9